MNTRRSELLRKLTPTDAIQAWLDGEFGFDADDESIMIEAIRKDSRINLSDDEIMNVVCAAADEGLDAQRCLTRLERMSDAAPAQLAKPGAAAGVK